MEVTKNSLITDCVCSMCSHKLTTCKDCGAELNCKSDKEIYCLRRNTHLCKNCGQKKYDKEFDKIIIFKTKPTIVSRYACEICQDELNSCDQCSEKIDKNTRIGCSNNGGGDGNRHFCKKCCDIKLKMLEEYNKNNNKEP